MTAFLPLIADALAGGGEAAAGAEATDVGIGESGGEAFSAMPQDLGHGHSIILSKDQIHGLLHQPEVVKEIMARGELILKAANHLAITKGAEYGITLQNRADTTRARVNIWTKNYKAVIDDHYHGTLLKACAQFPSDPKIPFNPEGEGEKPPSGEPTAEEAGAAEEGGAEGGSAAELAEVAEVAAL